MRQASSRMQVEYAKSIEQSDLEKLITYMALCDKAVSMDFSETILRNKP